MLLRRLSRVLAEIVVFRPPGFAFPVCSHSLTPVFKLTPVSVVLPLGRLFPRSPSWDEAALEFSPV